jgi:hypothetical protein
MQHIFFDKTMLKTYGRIILCIFKQSMILFHIRIAKGCYLNIEGSYRSKSILLQGRGDDKYYYSIYLSKYYFNNKLKLMLSADNFLNIHKINETEKATNNYTVKSYDKYYKASFMFSAILRLGKLKARVKETDKTIQRDTDIKYNYD